MTKWDATPTKQQVMLMNGWGKQLYIELGSLNIFYPFASSDLIHDTGAGRAFFILDKYDNYRCACS